MQANQNAIPATDRVIRVFVSSTFRDMQVEREELVKRVFPKLRKLCVERGVSWGEVDLRWGITEEQAQRGETLPICLAEIDRCQPYFICLLGDPSSQTTVVICLENDSRSLTCAMDVRSQLGNSDVPIFVHMREEGGLAALLRDAPGVHTFGMTSFSCSKDLLLHEGLDLLAKAIHEQYRENQKNNRKTANDPAMHDWQSLLPDLQDSNRQQADHIPVKLRAVGCSLVPANDPRPAVRAFTEEEVELLARMEHARWNADRFLAGWTLGPRNPENRVSPHLVTWDQLSDDFREYDREAVRYIFDLAKRIGMKICRSESVAAAR